MSVNFCQLGIGPKVRFGKGGSFLETTATGLQVRNPGDTAFDTLQVLTPALDTDAATKKYVDDLVSKNITWKEAAVVCGVINVVVAAPGLVIDGVTQVVGNRVVLNAQTVPVEDGVYVWNGAAVPMTLAADWAAGSEQSGSVISIREGTCADNIYIASADPAVVGVNAPVFLLIGTTAAGVTSVNPAVAVPAGGASFLAVPGTGAVTMNVLDDSARISVALVSNVITLDVKALSIGTGLITDDAVSNAKLAVGAADSCIWGDIVFGDAGSAVTIATGQAPVPATSRVTKVLVMVGTAFVGSSVNVDVQVGGVSVMGNADSDLNAADTYICDNPVLQSGVVTAVVSAAAGLTAGAARIMVCYSREA